MRKNALATACSWLTWVAAAVPSVTAMAGVVQNEPVTTQTPTDKEQKKKEPVTNLEAVKVQATRRSTDIDTVPVAVTAISGDALHSSTVMDTQSLPMLSPSLAVSISGNETGGSVIRIRGIGTAASNPGLESAVGVFIDGIYRARAGLALDDLYDIDQVEVLRGPQSTLFGKNTSAGAISIEPKKPTFTPEGYGSVSVGNYGSQVYSGAWSGPINDKLAVRFSGQFNKRDGYITNVDNGDDYNNRDRWSMRGQLLWTPSTDFSLRLVADTSHKHEQCCAAPFTQYGATEPFLSLLGGHMLEPDHGYHVAINNPPISNVADSGFATHMEWNLGWATAKAVLGYRNSKALNSNDADYTDVGLVSIPEDHASLVSRSADITLNGNTDRVDWLVGTFYSKDTLGLDGRTLLGDQAGYFLLGRRPPTVIPPYYPSGTGQTRHSQQWGDSDSLYTHNIVHFDHGIDLTLGARYVQERKTGYGYSSSNVPACTIPHFPAAGKVLCAVPAYDAHYSDNRTVGVASLSKTIGDGNSVYASYSRGYKAGGINLDPGNLPGPDPTFKPESVDAYEMGLKLAMLDRSVFLRTAVFQMDYKDVQLNTFNGLGFFISNQASARSKGVEIEGEWYVAPGYMLHGGYTYDQATYGNDTTDPALRNKQITNAPKSSAVLGFNVDQPIGTNTLTASLNARYQSRVNTGANLAPQKEQGAYAVFNARIGMRFPNQLQVSLWANNITNRYRNLVIFDTTVQTGSFNGYPDLPRMWGLEVRKDF